jgi:hypothetical protein
MTDTTKGAADALMKLAERLRMAPLSGGEYRTAHAELESAILSAIERARADERERCAKECEADGTIDSVICAQAIRALGPETGGES